MKKTLISAALLLFMFAASSCSHKSPFHPGTNNTSPPNTQLVQNLPDDSAPKDTESKSDIEKDTLNNPDSSGISNKERDWGFRPNSNHDTPEIPSEVKSMLDKYSGYYVGDTSSKVLYLTYDEGYENGYTPQILDILKANDVKAAFFVVKPYITQNPDIIKRMVSEGHLVCNHSSKHPSMPSRANNTEAFNKEFTDVENAFKEVTGVNMPKYFRPPMGKFSEKSLYLTKQLGYKTIFWSFAHKDWEVNNQPSVKQTHDIIMKRVHNGSIVLLHAVSKSNTDALDSVIKELKAQGYRFGTLDELK